MHRLTRPSIAVQQATSGLGPLSRNATPAAPQAVGAAGPPDVAGWPTVEGELAGLTISDGSKPQLTGLSEEELKAVLLKTLCEEGMDAVVRQVKDALDARRG